MTAALIQIICAHPNCSQILTYSPNGCATQYCSYHYNLRMNEIRNAVIRFNNNLTILNWLTTLNSVNDITTNEINELSQRLRQMNVEN